MKAYSVVPRKLFDLQISLILAVGALGLSGGPAIAREASGAISYSPISQNVEGVAPWVQSYVVTITAPSDLTDPTTATMIVVPTAIPGGLSGGPIVDEATALGFVTVSPSALVFTTAGESQLVRITVSMPSLPSTGDLLFTYAVQAIGLNGNSVFDPAKTKTTINATATGAVAAGSPPTVSIATPVQAEIFTYTASTMPTAIPLQFQANAPKGAAITAVEVRLNGNTVAAVVNYSNNNTVAAGSASLPIAAAGSYTVVVRATNKFGIGSDSHPFTVNVAGPRPTIVITQPAPDTDYTYFVGGSPVVVPNSFTASTPPASTLQTWTAMLTAPDLTTQNLPISPTNPSGQSSTGSVQLSLSTSGRYSLAASVANQFASASAATYFWINRITNPVDQTVDAFQNATFAITAAGRTDFTYRWYRQPVRTIGYTALTDDTTYSGTTTPTLLVTQALVSMTGDRFKCVLTRTGGNIESMSALLTVRRLTPVLTWLTPAAIGYGTALTGTQLNATASVLGSFVYTPASGTVLGAGSQTLSVTFTPSDSANYSVVTTTVTQQVNKAPLTIKADNKSMTVGGTVPTLTATYSGFVNGDTVAAVSVVTLSTTATSASSVGTYPITVAGGTGANYTTTLVNGTLTVNAATSPPPTVVINTPPAGSTYARVAGGPALSIPLTFTGTSMTTGGVITQLTASLNGTPLTVTPTNLNQRVATGAATMSVTSAGTYTISVSAKDAYGTAVAARTFVVTVTQGHSICGTVFFDVNFNGVFDGNGDCDDHDHWGDDDHHSSSYDRNDWDDCRGSRNDRYSDRGNCRDYGDRYSSRDYDDDDEHGAEDFGLGGVTVKLYKIVNSSRQLIASTTTAADGNYCFNNLTAGGYVVSAVEPVGYDATTQTERSVTISTKNVVVRDIGFGLDFGQIRNHCADGKSDDFWHTQLDKCLKGDTRNFQVSASKCTEYTTKIGNLALTVYDGISMKSARSILESNSWLSRDQLSKQLIAAEYNYSNGAYINGNKTLTYCFIQWGERVHMSTSSYSNSYVKWARDWFEAYNTSGGGRIDGPR